MQNAQSSCAILYRRKIRRIRDFLCFPNAEMRIDIIAIDRKRVNTDLHRYQFLIRFFLWLRTGRRMKSCCKRRVQGFWNTLLENLPSLALSAKIRKSLLRIHAFPASSLLLLPSASSAFHRNLSIEATSCCSRNALNLFAPSFYSVFHQKRSWI